MLEAEPYLEQYGGYAYYTGIGISALVLLLICCYIFGLSIGLCCSVSGGAKWLLAAVYLTALLTWAVFAMVAVLFIAGSTVDSILCDSLKNPNESEIVQYLDTEIHHPHNHNHAENSSLADVITDCKTGKTLFLVFGAGEIYGDQLRGWKDWAEDIDLKAIKGLEGLESKIIDTNWTQLGDQLIDPIRHLGRIEAQLKLVEELNNSTVELTGGEVESLQTLIRNISDVKLNLEELGDEAAKQAKDSEMSLIENEFLNRTIGLIGGYVDRVIERIESEVGDCRPLANSNDATVVAVCGQGCTQ